MKQNIEKMLEGLSLDDIVRLLEIETVTNRPVNHLWQLVKGSEYSNVCRFNEMLQQFSLRDLEWVVFSRNR